MKKIKKLITITLAVTMLFGATLTVNASYAPVKRCPKCSSSTTASMDASGHYTYHCNNLKCRYSFI